MGSSMDDKTTNISDPDDKSCFGNIARAPDIPVYAVMAAFKEDPSPLKLNLGIGVYRTEEGKPHLLDVVRKAESIVVNDLSLNKSYSPPTGLPEFNRLSAELLFGCDSPAIKESRVKTIQCLSGSGSLRIGADFLSDHYHHTVYIPQPTYPNHPNFFHAAGLDLKTYRYYDPTTRGLDFRGLIEDLSSAPSGSIVLLQMCNHNPTGVDPTLQQWEQIRHLIRSKGMLPFFDCAYQGFVSGDLDLDAKPIRMFVADGGDCLAAQSYSKIMGLYAERVGTLSIVCTTADVASRLHVYLERMASSMYLTPPIHGQYIVTSILKDREMYQQWTIELKAMAHRVTNVRRQLFDALECRGTPGDWSHIIKQVGMFTLSGLSEEQVTFLAEKFHIYMSSDGRINMAGLSLKTVPYLADAIHAVTLRIV